MTALQIAHRRQKRKHAKRHIDHRKARKTRDRLVESSGPPHGAENLRKACWEVRVLSDGKDIIDIVGQFRTIVLIEADAEG